jgi:predicted dehydrogenase
MDPDRTPWRREYSWHDNPFKLELRHFGECIRTGKQPLTPGREAIDDIQLVGDIVKTYLSRSTPVSELAGVGSR